MQTILQHFEESLDVTKDYLSTNLEEGSNLEFKNSLQTKSDTIDKQYLKTIAGFANNSGGTIIFGISPDRKEIVGIKEDFENLDNRYISTTINLGLDGSFQYCFVTKRFLGKIVGFLIIEKALNKPIIMNCDASEFRTGEIYYRYPAQTTKILASDLRRIIDEEISNKLEQTIGNISKLVSLGKDAAILNTQSGVIDSGKSLPKFTLDEKILKKLNFIKLGQFVEKEGAPAYIITGEIEGGNVEVIEKKILSNLFERDIIKYFTEGVCDCPKLVLEKLTTLPSYYFPIHYFIKQSDITSQQAIEYLSLTDERSVNKITRTKIIERINTSYDYGKKGKILSEVSESLSDRILSKELIDLVLLEIPKPKPDKSKIKRTLIFNSLNEFEPLSNHLITNETVLVIEAFSNISADTLNANREYFLHLIDNLNNIECGNGMTTLRKVICFVDFVFFSPLLVLSPTNQIFHDIH